MLRPPRKRRACEEVDHYTDAEKVCIELRDIQVEIVFNFDQPCVHFLLFVFAVANKLLHTRFGKTAYLSPLRRTRRPSSQKL